MEGSWNGEWRVDIKGMQVDATLELDAMGHSPWVRAGQEDLEGREGRGRWRTRSRNIGPCLDRQNR